MSLVSTGGITGEGQADLRFVAIDGPCWRAVPAGTDGAVLAGTIQPGRWNRPGERTLYMSGSPAGVIAAMTRYGEGPRTIVPLTVSANRLVDLRDPAHLAAMAFAPEMAATDWRAALASGGVPPSWPISDFIRGSGAVGLIDPSRRLPGAWHLVLFRWNVPGAPVVTIRSR